MARPKKQQPAPKAPDGIVQFERVASCSDTNGVMSSQPVTINFDPRADTFSIPLPPHLIAHGGKSDTVYADRVVDVVQQFEQICEGYSITSLHLQATQPMLLVVLRDQPSDLASNQYLLDVGLMMGVVPVAVNPADLTRVYRREGDKVLSIALGKQLLEQPCVLLPDTPEIHDRLDAMRTSIFQASNVFRTLIETPDPAAFLLSMEGPWTVKAEPQATDSTQAVAPASPAFANDDEF